MPPEGQPSWKDSLPPELKESPALKDVADIPGLAKQFIDQQSFLGSSLRIPSKDSSADQVKEFHAKVMEKVPGLMLTPDMTNTEVMNQVYNRMGRPDKAEKYAPPEGVKLDETDLLFFKGIAHKNGLNQRQFESMVKEIGEQNNQVFAEMDRKKNESIAELKKEWGAVHEERMNAIKGFMITQKAPTELIDEFMDGTAGVEAIKWMHGIVAAVGVEGTNVTKEKGEDSGRMTPAEAQAKVNEIMSNRDHAYWNGSDPGHAAAVARVIAYMKDAYPDASTDRNLRTSASSGA